jgi:hypothetical protein
MGPVMQAAQRRAAGMRMPGAYAFTDDQPPVTKLADNGLDQIIDVAATEAKYAQEEVPGG